MMVPSDAEVASLKTAVSRHFHVNDVVAEPAALSFQVGVPSGGIDAPFDALRLDLVARDYVPSISLERGKTLVRIERRPIPRFAHFQVNLVLLLITILTTAFFGGAWTWSVYAAAPILSAESIVNGTLFFTVPLLTILGFHEMGHYLVAKRHKVRTSLPFFLPSVPPLGTFGAFISLRDPIPSRRALLDIGVAGPLVGLAIAVPMTLAGLSLSASSPMATAAGGATQSSVLFSLLSIFFPLPDSFLLHPLAFAGWVGLFVTAINLFPAGQLDGGHVARALLGDRQYYLSWAAVLILFGLGIFYVGWILFAVVVLVLGVRHPPPLNDITRLDGPRKLVGAAAVVILLLTFVPHPSVAVPAQRGIQFEDLSGSPIGQIEQDIFLRVTTGLMFMLNNTGGRVETVSLTILPMNLDAIGFNLQIVNVTVGDQTTDARADEVTFALNSTSRAVVVLFVHAPDTWPTNLPQRVTFTVRAATLDGALVRELAIKLRLT